MSAPDITAEDLQAIGSAIEALYSALGLRAGSPIFELRVEREIGGWFLAAETRDGRGFVGQGTSVFAACVNMTNSGWTE